MGSRPRVSSKRAKLTEPMKNMLNNDTFDVASAFTIREDDSSNLSRKIKTAKRVLDKITQKNNDCSTKNLRGHVMSKVSETIRGSTRNSRAKWKVPDKPMDDTKSKQTNIDEIMKPKLGRKFKIPRRLASKKPKIKTGSSSWDILHKSSHIPLDKHIGTTTSNAIPDETEYMDLDVEMDVPETRQVKNLVVVADTNVWINDINIMEDILNKKFRDEVTVRIVIPWMVLQELDAGNNLRNQVHASRRPIRFINNLLASKHPRVVGQKASEAALCKMQYSEMIADDSILNCVFQNQTSDSIVVFISNDKNLLNKALVNEVIAVPSEVALRKLDEMPEFVDASRSTVLPSLNVHMPMQESEKTIFKLKGKSTFSTPSTGNQDNSNWQDLLRLALDHIIRKKMVEDNGEDNWERVVKVKPPWTIVSALRCISLHWITNFSFVFTRYAFSNVEKLQNLLKDYFHNPWTPPTQNEVIESAIALLNLISNDYAEDQPIKKCKLQLLSLCEKRPSK